MMAVAAAGACAARLPRARRHSPVCRARGPAHRPGRSVAAGQEDPKQPDRLEALRAKQEASRQLIERRQQKRLQQAEEEAAVPAPWRRTEHPTSPGEWYYYNTETGETSWELPLAVEAAGGTDVTDVWERVQHPATGEFYYHNTVTGDTSWEEPSGFAEQTAEGEDAGLEVPVVQESVSADPGNVSSGKRGVGRPSEADISQGEDAKEDLEPEAGDSGEDNVRGPAADIDQDEEKHTKIADKQELVDTDGSGPKAMPQNHQEPDDVARDTPEEESADLEPVAEKGREPQEKEKEISSVVVSEEEDVSSLHSTGGAKPGKRAEVAPVEGATGTAEEVDGQEDGASAEQLGVSGQGDEGRWPIEAQARERSNKVKRERLGPATEENEERERSGPATEEGEERERPGHATEENEERERPDPATEENEERERSGPATEENEDVATADAEGSAAADAQEEARAGLGAGAASVAGVAVSTDAGKKSRSGLALLRDGTAPRPGQGQDEPGPSADRLDVEDLERVSGERKERLGQLKKQAFQRNIVMTARREVLRGKITRTRGGLKSEDLVKNNRGKIVSKKSSDSSKRRYAACLGKWMDAVKEARLALQITGFVPVGGKTAKGQELHARAKKIYEEMKAAMAAKPAKEAKNAKEAKVA